MNTNPNMLSGAVYFTTNAIEGKNPKMRMPRKGDPLTMDQIAKLKEWIDAGAAWPENDTDRAAMADKRLDHWAWQPIQPTAKPASIDAFVRTKRATLLSLAAAVAAAFLLSGCADSVSPKSRNVSIPSPKAAEERSKGLNENGDSVIYLPLGDDVLMPQTEASEPLPAKIVGPFEDRKSVV